MWGEGSGEGWGEDIPSVFFRLLKKFLLAVSLPMLNFTISTIVSLSGQVQDMSSN
jgi:hypothetical protein